MSCGKCGCNGCLCPVSLGFAIGVTASLGVIVWVVWAFFMGAVDFTWTGALMYLLLVFIKGFVFGFVVALIYDFIVKRCKRMCARKEDG